MNVDAYKEENKRENDTWDEAIYNAKEAFKNTFEKEGYDAAYWTIRIISHSMSSDFKNIMETKTWDELGMYELKDK